MSSQQTDPFGQQPHPAALQRTTANVARPANAANFEPQESGGNDYIPVPFSGQFNGQFNGVFMIPTTVYQTAPAESDAQIAARRAMTKRSSRSFAARVSKTRSRKMEIVGKPSKPGITVDTSFARHRGNVPHQVYPQEHDGRSGGSSRKQSWFGLGRSGTKNKGLGITKGTPQPERQPAGPAAQGVTSHHTKVSSSHRTAESYESYRADSSFSKDSKTADSDTQSSKTWQEISPWDRPIPIGISVPSDSVTEFSPDPATRQRSESDATLTTPSIIITPAAAMKSVWSPDTESDYNSARASSIYSRAGFYMQSAGPDVPPVPALPAEILKNAEQQSRSRNDTLDSADTAFEEDDDIKHRDRITSTATVFEEDETPLRDGNFHSTLSVDTSTVPTPRRSQGWWNVITTPFMMSRANSVWTQNGRNAERTPDVPMMPAEYSARKDSPSPPSTYIWSATERSASIRGDSPLLPPSLSTAVTTPEVNRRGQYGHVDPSVAPKLPPTARSHDTSNDIRPMLADKTSSVEQKENQRQHQQSLPATEANVTSPLSAMSASPVVGTATIGTVLNARQVEDQRRPINVNIELQDRRPNPTVQATNANTPLMVQHVHIPPPPPQPFSVDTSKAKTNTAKQTVPVFAPPPTFARKGSHFSYDNDSRPSTAISSASSPDLKSQKSPRKVGNLMSWLPFGRRHKNTKKQDKKKKKRSLCFWCCGCCIILLVLIAIIVPVVVVVTKKHNDGTNGTIDVAPGEDAPSQWLNLTGYPPIPTGVSTIAQPEAVEEENGCVAPATLWSCALPKEQQNDISPNKPDQPNFKLEIIFENGTVSDPSKTQPARRAANPVSAGAFIRSRFLNARAAPSASPAPPSLDDEKFLGQTTDSNSAPFEGEETPFFITFQDANATTTASRLAKRAGGDDDPTNITMVIPPPMLNPDGTAAPANLLTFPSSQPLRLFNRDKADEHYGFYTYFDRSIFLKDIKSTTGRGGNPADVDGGSTRDAATLRCTFSQTRYLVQIWTRSQTSKPLLGRSAQNASDAALDRPGTLPYPVTITLDRHGGDFAKKNLYCYQMEKDGTIKDEASKRFFQFEDRGFGGNLVNGTQGKSNVTGPIDGGSGGCRCQWQNWLT